jgi:hypothetical protein
MNRNSDPVEICGLLRRILLIFALAGCLRIDSVAADSSKDWKQNEGRIEQSALEGIRARETSEENFLAFLRKLSHLPSESAAIWADIITDDHYDTRRRKLAMSVLLRRHVTSRMTLDELAHLVPKNKLFNMGDIKPVEDFGKGPHPKFWLEGNVFFVKMVSGTHKGAGAEFYFVLDRKGRVARQMLLSALHGQPAPELEGVRLLDLKTIWDWPEFRAVIFP